MNTFLYHLNCCYFARAFSWLVGAAPIQFQSSSPPIRRALFSFPVPIVHSGQAAQQSSGSLPLCIILQRHPAERPADQDHSHQSPPPSSSTFPFHLVSHSPCQSILNRKVYALASTSSCCGLLLVRPNHFISAEVTSNVCAHSRNLSIHHVRVSETILKQFNKK